MTTINPPYCIPCILVTKEDYSPKKCKETPNRKSGEGSIYCSVVKKCTQIFVYLLFKLKNKKETVTLNVQALCRLINSLKLYQLQITIELLHVSGLFSFFADGFCLFTWVFLLSYSFLHIYNAVQFLETSYIDKASGLFKLYFDITQPLFVTVPLDPLATGGYR